MLRNARIFYLLYDALIFLDCETTGFDPKTNRIIELAAIKAHRLDSGEVVTDKYDMFVKLPDGERIPEEIVALTGITDEKLRQDGLYESEVARGFMEMIRGNRKTLLVAHNAHFDLRFVNELLRRNGMGLNQSDCLDTLTVFKDRRAYPHKLSDAISAYGLTGVANSHRAIDDAEATLEVFKAMYSERPDLLDYVNLFGYNPKYGVDGEKLPGVEYKPQRFGDGMKAPNETLPHVARRYGDGIKTTHGIEIRFTR